jgi:hypothetical protein
MPLCGYAAWRATCQESVHVVLVKAKKRRPTAVRFASMRTDLSVRSTVLVEKSVRPVRTNAPTSLLKNVRDAAGQAKSNTTGEVKRPLFASFLFVC